MIGATPSQEKTLALFVKGILTNGGPFIRRTTKGGLISWELGGFR